MAQYTPTTGTFACPTTTGIWTIDAGAALPSSPWSLNPPAPVAYSFTGTLTSLIVVTPSIGSTEIGTGGTSQTGEVTSGTSGTITSGVTASATLSSSSCIFPLEYKGFY